MICFQYVVEMRSERLRMSWSTTDRSRYPWDITEGHLLNIEAAFSPRGAVRLCVMCISVGCAGQMCKMCTTAEEIKWQMLFVWGGGSVGAADVLSCTTAAPPVSLLDPIKVWSAYRVNHNKYTSLLCSILTYFHTGAKPTSPSASIYKYSLCTLALIWAVTSETDTRELCPHCRDLFVTSSVFVWFWHSREKKTEPKATLLKMECGA